MTSRGRNDVPALGSRGTRAHGRVEGEPRRGGQQRHGTLEQRERVAAARARDRRNTEAVAAPRRVQRPGATVGTARLNSGVANTAAAPSPTKTANKSANKSANKTANKSTNKTANKTANKSANKSAIKTVASLRNQSGSGRVQRVTENLKADARSGNHSHGRQDRHARHIRRDRRSKPLARVKPMQRRSSAAKRFVPGVFRAGTPRKRLIALLVGAAVVFGGILFRITMLQTADAGSYILAGTHQRTEETKLRASRGVIFDRNGDELALSVPATTIFVNPKLVLDPVGTAAILATTLHLTATKQQSLATAMSDKTKGFVYVARQIDDATAKAVTGLRLAGVESYGEDTRVIPGGDLASGVIGRTDTDGKGIAGLELQYDDLLTGTNGELVQEHDRKGNAIPGSGTVSVPAVPGKDLVLTIDRSIQFSLEQALLVQVSALSAKAGTAIVEETGTGNILAMASVERSDDGSYHVTSANLGAVACQEPGSVAKVITTSAALNEQVIAPDTYIQVPYYQTYNKGTPWEHTIRDAEPHPTQMMSTTDILVHSSNIGTIAESEKLGVEKQWDYMTAFGLGTKSALNFPAETRGQLKPWQQWEGTEKVTKAYGYGFCATAIQLVGAVNVVANNGVYVSPRLVQGTVGNDGKVVDAAPAATRTVLSAQTAQEMNTMMRAVVCDGTAKAAQVDGVTIAGKTGTGVKSVNGTYGKEGVDAKYYASFIGFFPAEAPKVTTLISIDEPDPTNLNRFGGTAAAPVFKAVVPTVMHQLEIQPPTTAGGCPAK